MDREIEIINKILKYGFTREIMIEMGSLDGDERYRVFSKLDDVHKNKYVKFREEINGRRKGGL